jgi:hypothetical protein
MRVESRNKTLKDIIKERKKNKKWMNACMQKDICL